MIETPETRDATTVRPSAERMAKIWKEKTEELALTVKKIEMKIKYQKEAEQFFLAAAVYAKVDGQENWEYNKDKEGHSEYRDPKLIENVYLVQYLEPLELAGKKPINQPDTDTRKQLRALETLDYCHSAEKMAKRTGLKSSEIEAISLTARSAVSSAGAEVLEEAYLAKGAEVKSENERSAGFTGIDPNSFSRELAVFITQEDMSKLSNSKPIGKAIHSGRAIHWARLALVTVDKGVRYQDGNQCLYRVAIHELVHLFRQTQKERLHQHFLNFDNDQKRLAANLEEGGTELFTRRAMKKVFPNLDVKIWESSEYTTAADRIDQGLIPKLVDEYEQRKNLLTDMVFNGHGNPPRDPERVLRARLMLGDYEMLQRITDNTFRTISKRRLDRQIIRNKAAGLINQQRPYYPPWHDAADALTDPEVFGFEYEFKNGYWELPAAGDVDMWGNPRKTGENMDIRKKNEIQLPIVAERGDGYVTLKPEYTYDVQNDDKTWTRIQGTVLTVTVPMNMRVNYVEVRRDSAGEKKE